MRNGKRKIREGKAMPMQLCSCESCEVGCIFRKIGICVFCLIFIVVVTEWVTQVASGEKMNCGSSTENCVKRSGSGLCYAVPAVIYMNPV